MKHQRNESQSELTDDGRSHRQEPARTDSFAGCVFILFTLTVTALMLLINSVFCLSLHTAFRAFAPELFSDNAQITTPLSQMFFFIAPIVLMILEWNWLDRMTRHKH